MQDANDEAHSRGESLLEAAPIAASPETECPVTFCTPAKMTAKRFGVAPSGMLTLTGDRLTFTTSEGIDVDTTLDRITNITVPWYFFRTGFRCTIDGKRYTCTFDKVRISAYSASYYAGRVGGELVGGATGEALGSTAGAVTGAVGMYRQVSDLPNAAALTNRWLTLLRGYPEPDGAPVRALVLFCLAVLAIAGLMILAVFRVVAAQTPSYAIATHLSMPQHQQVGTDVLATLVIKNTGDTIPDLVVMYDTQYYDPDDAWQIVHMQIGGHAVPLDQYHSYEMGRLHQGDRRTLIATLRPRVAGTHRLGIELYHNITDLGLEQHGPIKVVTATAHIDR